TLSNVHVEIMTALVSFDRVFEVLDLEPAIKERPDAEPVPSGPLSVEFDRVSFRYPGSDEASVASLEKTPQAEAGNGDTQVLSEVSFRAEPGTMVALVGPSGAGKTTLTHLVSRLYAPTEGTVRVGGRDLTRATSDSLRESGGVGVPEQRLHAPM